MNNIYIYMSKNWISQEVSQEMIFVIFFVNYI